MSLNKAYLQIFLWFCLLATMVTCIKAGGGGNHHKKIIIHVPFKVKHHHHTHTIYKHVHHGAHAASPHNGDDYYEVLGYTYGSPHKGAAPVPIASDHAPSYTSFGAVPATGPIYEQASIADHSAPYAAYTGYEDDGFGGSHTTFTTHSSFSGEEHEPFPPYTGNDLVSLSPYEGEIRARTGYH